MARCARSALWRLLLLGAVCEVGAEAPVFRLELSQEACSNPYTGRVWVVLSQDERREPLRTVGWSTRSLIYAMDAQAWQPGTALTLDGAKSMRYGEQASSPPPGRWRAQAAIDLVPWSHQVLRGPGNPISAPVDVEIGASGSATVSLALSRVNPDWVLEDRDDCKYVRLPSRLLSEFHKRAVEHRACVALPASYNDEPQRDYPAIYVIGGFGTDVRDDIALSTRDALAARDAEAIVILLDADCPTGHHVFADSANNGPVGTALIEELLPHLEKTFRLRADSGQRFVTGHSSGGWSSLWLQITYPQVFGGCWSTSPDPVDFHAFQTIDIYEAGANMYELPDGALRPLSRSTRGMALMTKPFSELEEILGRGGQLQSFEAVFSPVGPDGKPAKLWDRKTGRIDPEVAKQWRKYDIRVLLTESWERLGAQLRGKLYLACGDQDTFFLERAFFLLRDELKRSGSDAKIEIVPGAGHGLNPTAWQKVWSDMADRLKAADADWKKNTGS